MPNTSRNATTPSINAGTAARLQGNAAASKRALKHDGSPFGVLLVFQSTEWTTA